MNIIQDFIGWIVGAVLAAVGWFFKVTYDQEKRITALETKMDNLPKETAAEVVRALNDRG